jgi:hypothetical protein
VEEHPIAADEENEEELAQTATTPPPVFLAGSESPGARSNMSISGTTAISNLSESEAAELNGTKMLFRFPTLYDAAQDIFRILTPRTSPDPKLAEIIRFLKIPGSDVSDNLDFSENVFRNALNFFRVDGEYVRPQAVMKCIFGENLPEPDAKASAVAEIVQTANLALFAVWIASADQGNPKTWNLLRSIDNAFPSLFLTSFLEPQIRKSSSSGAWNIGSSTLLNQTFQFALELRTQVAVLAFIRQQGREDFDAEQVIRDVFYLPADDDRSDTEQLRTWGINGLGGDVDLHPEFDQQMQERISVIRHCFYEDTQALSDGASTDLEQLQVKFPWPQFTVAALKWIRRRHQELAEFIANRGDVRGIVSSVKQELDVEDSMIGVTATPRVQTRDVGQRETPRANEKKSKNTSLHRSVLLLALREHSSELNTSLVDNPDFMKTYREARKRYSGIAPEDRTVHARSEEEMENPTTASKSQRNAENKRIQTVEIKEDGWHPVEDVESDLAETGPSNNLQASQPLQNLLRKKKANKENVPHSQTSAPPEKARMFNEPQPDARRLEWDEATQTPSQQRQRPGKSSRRLDVEDVSEDDGFQNDTRIINPAPRKEIPISSRPVESIASRPSPKRQRVQQRQMSESINYRPSLEVESESESNDDKRRTIMYQQLTAKSTQGISRPRKKPQTRRGWSSDEIAALVGYIEEIGTSWAQIKRVDEEDAQVLSGRDQGALKDKARNLKVDFLK